MISIIGPNTINPIRAPMGNCPAKLLATTASAEEQRERKNAIPISTRRGRNSPSPPFPHGNDLSRGWNRADTRAPSTRYFPTLKNSVCVWRR